MISTRDFVTRENCWQIASLVTQKSLFTVTLALFFIYFHPHKNMTGGTQGVMGVMVSTSTPRHPETVNKIQFAKKIPAVST